MGKNDSSSITHHSNIPLFQLFRTCCFFPKKPLDERGKKALWSTALGGVLEWSRKKRQA